MAEALAIVGLVSSIVRFVDFSTKVVDRLKEFRSSAIEVPKTFHDVLIQLPLLNNTLERTLDQAKGNNIAEGTAEVLVPVIDGCLVQVKLLGDILAKVVPKEHDSSWIRGIKALSSLARDKNVQQITATLEIYVQALTYHQATSSAELRSKFATAVQLDVSHQHQHQHQDQHHEVKETRKLLREVCEWLAPVTTIEDYERARVGRSEGTCMWVNQNPHVSRWLSSKTTEAQPQLLWITGVLGCGKTHIAAYIIESLQRQRNQSVAYFFCTVEDIRKRSTRGILSTWVWQLLQQNQEQVDQIADICCSSVSVNTVNLKQALHQLLSGGLPCRIVLDGLDECEIVTRKEILDICGEIVNKAQILILSRDESDISRGIQRATRSSAFDRVKITMEDNKRDIQQYLQERIRDMELNNIHLEQEIFKKLYEGANGMFLWAHLMIEQLEQQDTIGSMEESLQDLPDGLDATFGRILVRISAAKQKSLAKRILEWTTYASYPLTVSELECALTIVPGEARLDPKNRIRSPKKTFLDLCEPLIELDNAGGTIRLVHASVRGFLINQSLSSEPFVSLLITSRMGNNHIARVCLTYLTSEDRDFAKVNDDLEQSTQHLKDSFQNHAFLRYSTLNWWVHALNSTLDEELCVMLQKFIASEDSTIKWLQALHYTIDDGRYGRSEAHSYIHGLSLLEERLGSHFGLEKPVCKGYREWISHLLPPKGSRFSPFQRFVDSGPVSCYPPLQIAAHFNFLGVIQSELRDGADVNGFNHYGETAAHQAARADAAEALQLLLASGANLNIQSRVEYHSLLHRAVSDEGYIEAQSGPYRVVPILLDAGINVHAQDNHGATTLHYMCSERRDGELNFELIKELLEYGAVQDILVKDIYGKTPLHLVARHNYAQIAKIFLDNGASPNGEPGTIRGHEITPLHSAASVRSSSVLPMLLEAGADVNATDRRDNSTPLHIAARHCFYGVRALVLAGANVHSVDQRGRLPLHYAAMENIGPAVQFLIEHGSDIQMRDDGAKTPLLIAVENNAKTALELLLQAGSARGLRWNIGAVSSLPPDVEAILSEYAECIEGSVEYSVQSSHEVFHALFLMKCCFRQEMPMATLKRILELANYWIKSSTSRSDDIVVTEKSVGPSYLQSHPIRGRARQPVKKLVFTIMSHDQGSSSYPKLYGSYDNSWTWFDAKVCKASGDGEIVHGPRIQVNVHASRKVRVHTVVWLSDAFDKTEKETSVTLQWVRSLEVGDIVWVVPCALYPGWENHVKRAQIDVYTSCL